VGGLKIILPKNHFSEITVTRGEGRGGGGDSSLSLNPDTVHCKKIAPLVIQEPLTGRGFM
jgi:hypothetical protein